MGPVFLTGRNALWSLFQDHYQGVCNEQLAGIVDGTGFAENECWKKVTKEYVTKNQTDKNIIKGFCLW